MIMTIYSWSFDCLIIIIARQSKLVSLCTEGKCHNVQFSASEEHNVTTSQGSTWAQRSTSCQPGFALHAADGDHNDGGGCGDNDDGDDGNDNDYDDEQEQSPHLPSILPIIWLKMMIIIMMVVAVVMMMMVMVVLTMMTMMVVMISIMMISSNKAHTCQSILPSLDSGVNHKDQSCGALVVPTLFQSRWWWC